MNTTTETLSVNGVVLNTLAKNIESIAGRLHMAPKKTPNVVVPGKPGVLYVPGKLDDVNHFVLPMWVRGCDDNGLIPGGSSARVEFFKNLDALTRLFRKSSSLLDIRHVMPDTTTRQVFAEVLEEIDFTTIGANPLGKYSVTLEVPDVYWQDLNLITQNIAAVVNNTTYQYGQFDGGTAPIFDSVITITGPFTNITLTDVESNDFVTLGTAVAAGATAVIDNVNMTVVSGANDLLTTTSHSGDVFLALFPNDLGQHKLKVTGAGFTAATAVQVAGRRKYVSG